MSDFLQIYNVKFQYVITRGVWGKRGMLWFLVFILSMLNFSPHWYLFLYMYVCLLYLSLSLISLGFISSLLFLKKEFLRQFQSKTERKVQRFPMYSLSLQCIPFPLSTSPTRLYICCSWHIIIIQSPLFTLGFTFEFVHSMCLNTCIMTCIHHYLIL